MTENTKYWLGCGKIGSCKTADRSIIATNILKNNLLLSIEVENVNAYDPKFLFLHIYSAA